ncbi:BTAD domain-containing putative transcriptional regulator [Streptomyces sp. NPDC051162]|uniref:BTAD domain-containing putative transcriptional regulator n=1 Tax=Streptomyces sp. NPDC051162 TaxID=3154747 RepID=UPI003417D4F2
MDIASFPAQGERTVRFLVLGPLEVIGNGRRFPLRGLTQRMVLGFLLLHTNRAVAMSDLVKALWPNDAPPTARKMLQNAVSGLRGTLTKSGIGGETAALLSRAPGYALRVDPDCLDLARFQYLAGQGRAELTTGSWEPAARSLREALALWRGSALEDLVESGVAWPELAGIQSARMAAREDCFEAELASGRHHEVVWELEVAVDLDPERERMCALLMLALYRCGRQVDALGIYRRHRARLLEQLGLEPARELQELERAILNHDPALDLTAQGRVAGVTATTHVAGVSAPAHVAGVTAPRQHALDTASRPMTRTAAYPAIRSAPARTTSHSIAPKPVRLVDRGPELEVLRSVLDMTRKRQRPHLVTVLGESGSGKSRLISELRSALRKDEGAVRCLIGRTPPVGHGTGMTALAEIIKSPLPPARRGADAVDGEGGREAPAALRGALERMAAARPLVAVLDDVHRANDTLLDFLDEVVRTAAAVPLLVIVTARPELLEQRPDWGGGRLRATTITL